MVLLETSGGKIPFLDWLAGLRDQSLEISVDARLTRIEDGNFGDHKSVGEGVFELRIPKGPGLRVYYSFDSNGDVVLINGGDKNTQKRDIKRSHVLWMDYINAK